MKIIFFTFALLAITNASFLRQLQTPTVGIATYSTSCTNFKGLKVTAPLTDATAIAADTAITLANTTEITVTIPCNAVTEGATELVCEKAGTVPDGTDDGLTFSISALAGYTITTQTSFVTYHADYKALGTNNDQEVDYDDESKTNFTVVYKDNFAEGDELPEIKVGNEVVNCSLTTTATTLTCAPSKDKIKKSDDKYQITAENACGTYDNVAKLTVKDAAAFLKASLALLVAVFLF
jgi:hypothetical protein